GNGNNATEDKTRWGPIYVGNIDFNVPVYTWKRKEDLLLAAENGRKVKEQDVQLKINEVRYQVKESYWGYLYASSLMDFAKDIIDKLKDNIEQAKKRKGRTQSLEILLAQIQGKKAEIEKNFYLTQSSLALRLGMGPKQKIIPNEEWLESTPRELKPLEYYQDLAKNNKPEFQQLRSGIIAKDAMSNSQKKANWPMFAFITRYEFSYTSMRPRQEGIFTYDPYNRWTFLMGVGLRWSWDFGVNDALTQKFRAEAMELKAKEFYAQDGFNVLVEKSWREVKEAEEKFESAKAASKIAKSWLTRLAMNYGLGLGDTKELVEAYQARMLTLRDFYEAIFQHHMSWANLSSTVGLEVDPAVL
ncbi:MAG: TolC family protein, partial [Pseudomonadota bacterium]